MNKNLSHFACALILSGGLFGASSIWAADTPVPAINLTCSTEPASTVFQISTVGDRVLAHVIHLYGSEYAPAISGVYTPHDMPVLKEQTDLIKQMKSDMTFYWPLKNCKLIGAKHFECWNTGDVETGEGGVKFSPFALYTTVMSEDGPAGHLNSVQVTLTLSSGDKEARLEMKYDDQGCL